MSLVLLFFICFFYFLIFLILEFELRVSLLQNRPSIACTTSLVHFGRDILDYLPGLAQTLILLISASQVTRITGVSDSAWP
jgi:hypothetical protein